ncbi:MAG TPA: flavin reductase family protein [Ktedonobacterales bacterium]
MTVARSHFRSLMGHFTTGVTVVTAVEDSINYGMTVNAFCSVSLDPCLVLISLRRASATCEVIRRVGTFAVNILKAEQRPLAERFARHELDPSQRFAGLSFETCVTGAPLFPDALAHLECRMVAEYPGGDHVLLIGEVVGLEHGAEVNGAAMSPLVFYRSAYATLLEESLLPDAFPHGAAVAQAGGNGWARRLGRLWDGLWQWARFHGKSAGPAPGHEAPADAAIIEVSSLPPTSMSASMSGGREM